MNSGERRAGVWTGIVVLFLALRLPLLLAREPFFDELVSVWFAGQPLTKLWTTLTNNSESVLYFAIAHGWPGFDVMDGRVLSLLFGLATLAVCFWLREPAAGVMLAAFPAHVFFSTEARAYALVALMVGVAAVALQRGRYVLTTIALVLAAYAHGYGVLFFPVPFVASLYVVLAERRQQDSLPAHATPPARVLLRGFLSSAMCGVLFLPGFWLASVQPRGSLAWMEAGTMGERIMLVAKSLLQLGFAAEYAPIFLTSAPIVLQILSFLFVAIVVIFALRSSESARFHAIFIAVPLLAIVFFALAGKTFYFPTRFESVLSLPFALILAAGLAVLPPRRASVAVMSALAIIGAYVVWISAADHAAAPPSPYRSMAMFAKTAPVENTLVASGYAYIEVLSAVQPRDVIPYPRELAVHPGWPGELNRPRLELESQRLPGRFVWIGPARGEEARILRQRYDMRPVATAGPIVAAVAERRP